MNGCKDKKPPRDLRFYKKEYDMYFAKKSSLWDGGICFIKEGKSTVLFNLYLISSSQFRDITSQECGLDEEDSDFIFKLNGRDQILDDKKLYGKILYLGKWENNPIYTFTSPKDFTDEINEPSKYYLYHIVKGLKDISDLTDEEIYTYLKDKQGLEDEKELKDAFELYYNHEHRP